MEHECYFEKLQKYIQENFPQYDIRLEDQCDTLFISINNEVEWLSRIQITTEYNGRIAEKIRIKGLHTKDAYRKKGYATALLKIAVYYAKDVRKIHTIVGHPSAGGGANALMQEELEKFYQHHVEEQGLKIVFE